MSHRNGRRHVATIGTISTKSPPRALAEGRRKTDPARAFNDGVDASIAIIRPFIENQWDAWRVLQQLNALKSEHPPSSQK